MFPRGFALYGGIAMIIWGLLAFIPALQGPAYELPALTLNTSYGLFLGLFPQNILNKVAVIAFGIAGVIASQRSGTSLPASIWYSRIVFFAMGALAILGMFRETNTLYGYMPLFGAEAWFHGVVSIVGAYFGYALSMKVPDSGPAQTHFKTPLTGAR